MAAVHARTRAAGRSVGAILAAALAWAPAAGAFAFTIDFLPDEVVVSRRLGFAAARASVHLVRGDTGRLVARLVRVDALDTVRTVAAAPTSARLVDFEARRASGRGVFVPREEITRRGPASATDLLRGGGFGAAQRKARAPLAHPARLS